MLEALLIAYAAVALVVMTLVVVIVYLGMTGNGEETFDAVIAAGFLGIVLGALWLPLGLYSVIGSAYRSIHKAIQEDRR